MTDKWIDGKYGFSYLYLYPGSRDIVITVGWDSTSKAEDSGYRVSFLGITLKKRFTDLAQAKAQGERLAAMVLHKALGSL
jgi:hypothetical protein